MQDPSTSKQKPRNPWNDEHKPVKYNCTDDSCKSKCMRNKMAYRILACNKRSQESGKETPPDVAPSREAKEKAKQLETEPVGLMHARLGTSEEPASELQEEERRERRTPKREEEGRNAKERARDPSGSICPSAPQNPTPCPFLGAFFCPAFLRWLM